MCVCMNPINGGRVDIPTNIDVTTSWSNERTLQHLNQEAKVVFIRNAGHLMQVSTPLVYHLFCLYFGSQGLNDQRFVLSRISLKEEFANFSIGLSDALKYGIIWTENSDVIDSLISEILKYEWSVIQALTEKPWAVLFTPRISRMGNQKTN